MPLAIDPAPSLPAGALTEPVVSTARASTLAPAEVADLLTVDLASGLTGEEARERSARYGPNVLVHEPPRSAWLRLFDQFKSPLLGILAGAAVLSLLIGEVKEAIVVLFIVVLNAVLGFVQEGRAASALASLEQMLVTTATVRRDGRSMSLTADELVPGDVVELAAGDRIPADGRFVAAIGARVDESALTGESVPVDKQTEPIEADGDDLGVGDRLSCGFMNTTLVGGRAELVVTGTGMATEMGRIAGLLASADEQDTPLQRQLERLGLRLGIVAVGAALLVAVIRLIQGTPIGEAVLDAAALAVAAIPEGLPAVVTITLAIGGQQLAVRKAIVKRLHSVETLGSTTVICSDKTGTLTVNQMTAKAVVAGGQTYEVSGEGYATEGEITPSAGGHLDDAARAAALCNDTSVRDGAVVGDPTEAALVVLAIKAGVDVEGERERRPRLAEVPFDSATKFMATIHADGDGSVLYAKGAIDALLPRATSMVGGDGELVPLDDASTARLAAANQELAEEGLRVLVLAQRRLPRRVAAGDDPAGLVAELTILGLVGMVDPPRPEARDAIGLCHTAGVDVKMITGDHPATAGTIAAELGIEGRVITGRDVDGMTDEQLEAEIESIGVCARVSPEHKVRIVNALQARGHVVAMTGDGVNDAAALRHADIGVAMGITGTEVSKDAADMVLTDDNFATIVTAVERGRTIYDNIVKFVRFQLTTNLAAIGTILGASLLGLPSPLTALQVLFVNLIADGPPAMALGVDEPTPGTMHRPPRAPNETILDRPRFVRIAQAGVFMAIGTLLVLGLGRDIVSTEVALTMTFVTFVFFQLANVFNARTETATVFRRETFTNRTLWLVVGGVVLITMVMVMLPPLQSLFATVALSPLEWLVCIGVSLTVIAAEEVRKAIERGRARRAS